MFRCRSYNSRYASFHRLLAPLKCCGDLGQPQGARVVALSFALMGCAEMLTGHSWHLAGVSSMPVGNASGLAEGLPCSQPLSKPRAAVPHLQHQRVHHVCSLQHSRGLPSSLPSSAGLSCAFSTSVHWAPSHAHGSWWNERSRPLNVYSTPLPASLLAQADLCKANLTVSLPVNQLGPHSYSHLPIRRAQAMSASALIPTRSQSLHATSVPALGPQQEVTMRPPDAPWAF